MAERVLAAAAEGGDAGGVELDDPALGHGEQRDDDRTPVEHAAEALFALAQRDGPGLGLAHGLLVDCGVVEHEGRHLGEQHAFAEIFGGEREAGLLAREAEHAHAFRGAHDRKHRGGVHARRMIKIAALGVVGIPLNHDGQPGFDRPPRNRRLAAPDAVAAAVVAPVAGERPQHEVAFLQQ